MDTLGEYYKNKQKPLLKVYSDNLTLRFACVKNKLGFASNENNFSQKPRVMMPLIR